MGFQYKRNPPPLLPMSPIQNCDDTDDFTALMVDRYCYGSLIPCSDAELSNLKHRVSYLLSYSSSSFYNRAAVNCNYYSIHLQTTYSVFNKVYCISISSASPLNIALIIS